MREEENMTAPYSGEDIPDEIAPEGSGESLPCAEAASEDEANEISDSELSDVNEAENDAEQDIADTDKSVRPAAVNSLHQKLIYITDSLPDPDDAGFWESVAAVKPKSKLKKIFGITAIILIALLIWGYSLALERGKGWFANLFRGDQRIEFTLPIAETPEVDDNYKDADGRYTASGVAKVTIESVVQIRTYDRNALLPSGQGSGIIISSDGYIVTNAHVVSGENYGITVMLHDKTEYAALIVGSDESTDIAVLKIGLKNLTPAQFADSDLCEAGDEVVAIGSPAGYENTVTKGIISGLNRQIRAENSATAMSCIQIDAAINPGNSGGPLFNMWGQVIGITSSKLVAESYDNIGFAIATNSAKPIIERLVEDGYIPDRGRIGISYYAISSRQAQLYRLESGIYIDSIDPDCNVAKTKLQVGDIITEIDGEKAGDPEAVSKVMEEHSAGDEISCKVFRPSDDESSDGETFTITFKLNSDKSAMIKAKEDKD